MEKSSEVKTVIIQKHQVKSEHTKIKTQQNINIKTGS